MSDEQNKTHKMISGLENLSKDIQTGFEELRQEIRKIKKDVIHELNQIALIAKGEEV